MNIPEIAAGVALVLFIPAAPPYIIDTVRGHTKPERATWFIWSVLGFIAFVSQVKLGGTWSLVFAGLDAFGSFLTFLLSIRYGVGGWTRLDKIAIAVASVGVIISLIVHQPIIALLGVILADVSGTVLTIRKTFRDPGSETTISWLLVGTGALLGMVSVGRWDVGLLLYPAYLFVANYSIPATQLLGRLRMHVDAKASPHTIDKRY